MRNANSNSWAHLCMLALSVSVSSCATTGKSVALGGAVGAGTGAAIGAVADPGHQGQYRTRNVIIGAALGAATGMAAGAAIHGGIESSHADGVKEGKSQAVPVDPGAEPKLIPAEWRAEVIETKRVGNRLIPRHVEYVITEPARWQDGQ